MTAEQSRQHWSPAQEAEHQMELKRQRAAWEQRRSVEKAQQERDRKRAELESHLQSRARSWTDTTGSAPSMTVLGRWTEEYMDSREIEAELERDRKRTEAASLPHYPQMP